MAEVPLPAPARSSFVTVVAIIFIVLAGGSTLMAIAQNLMVNFLFPHEAFGAGAAEMPAGMPAIMVFVVAHMRLLFLAVLLQSATTLVAAIGLLKRWNWARLLFIAMLLLGIAWQGLGVLLQHLMMQAMSAQLPPLEGGAPDVAAMLLAMRGITLAFALLLSGLFGWIAYRLVQPQVVAEFS